MAAYNPRQSQTFAVQPSTLIKQYTPNMSNNHNTANNNHNIDAKFYQQYHQTPPNNNIHNHNNNNHNKHHSSSNNNNNNKTSNEHSNSYDKSSRESSPNSTVNSPHRYSHVNKPQHKHKISNQEPITQFQELNNIKKKTNKILVNKNKIIQNVYPSETTQLHAYRNITNT